MTTTCTQLIAAIALLSSEEQQELRTRLTTEQLRKLEVPCNLSATQLTKLISDLRAVYSPLQSLIN